MTSQKLPSGSWRYQKMINNIRYSFTSPNRLTKIETEEIFSQMARRAGNAPQSLTKATTMREAMEIYNDLKRPVLSPSTMYDYDRIPDRLPEWFNRLKFRDITALSLQKLINELTEGRSQKTVKNLTAYIQSVLRAIRGDTEPLRVDIKPTVKKTPYIPTAEEVRRVLEVAAGTPYYLQLYLACFGLRRSEVLALTLADLDGNWLTINKAMVRSSEGYVVKDYPKTSDSVRRVYLPDELCEAIRNTDSIATTNPNSVLKWLNRTCQKLDIPIFKLHALRHFTATEMAAAGIPEADILAFCGWSPGGDVMKRVYRHSRLSQDKERAMETGKALGDIVGNSWVIRG